MLKKLYLLFACFLMSASLYAQTVEAADSRGMSIRAGAEVSTFNPDWGCVHASPFTCFDHQLLGVTPFVDVNNLFIHRIGMEGELRFLRWRGPTPGLTESTYLAGPKVTFLRFKRKLTLSGKFLIGDGHIQIPQSGAGSGNYLAYEPGMTAEFRLTRRLSARADYEYQFWPGFQGVGAEGATSSHGGLTPNGFSVGASYSILR